MNLVTIIFSKNRPMQLLACLESLQKQCKDYADLNINVLYKTDILYRNGYKEIEGNYPEVNFVEERFFKDQLTRIMENTMHTFFVCDDTIFCNPFEVYDIVKMLDENQDLIGFSLRLGLNTVNCYSMGITQKLLSYEDDDGLITWEWAKQQGDYSYPLEVSSSIFRTADLLSITQIYLYNNPNDYEWMLYQNCYSFINIRPFLASFFTSVAFSNPVNKVQETNNNRFGNDVNYSSEVLHDLWRRGMKIDVEQFDGFVASGAHMEVDFRMVER